MNRRPQASFNSNPGRPERGISRESSGQSQRPRQRQPEYRPPTQEYQPPTQTPPQRTRPRPNTQEGDNSRLRLRGSPSVATPRSKASLGRSYDSGYSTGPVRPSVEYNPEEVQGPDGDENEESFQDYGDEADLYYDEYEEENFQGLDR